MSPRVATPAPAKVNYIGRLPKNDPMYGYLRDDICAHLGVHRNSADFRVYMMPASNHVYLYEDRHSQTRIIGKFFGGVLGRSPQTALHHMEREFNNLLHLRNMGLSGYPHYVARPLGHNANLNHVLVEEFCYGAPLSEFIVNAIRKGDGQTLFQKLTALAYFLATLHNRSAIDATVDFAEDCSYFDRIVERLQSQGRVGWDEAQQLYRLKDTWRGKAEMWEDRQVLVHGDVTPANILFGDGLWVIAIDLERMKRADRVFDVGRVTGELKHFFMQYAGDGRLAEPFIGHFLWEYACHFPDRHSAFESITRRNPFHMGLTLLRIARNDWIGGAYRRELLTEAKRTLA